MGDWDAPPCFVGCVPFTASVKSGISWWSSVSLWRFMFGGIQEPSCQNLGGLYEWNSGWGERKLGDSLGKGREASCVVCKKSLISSASFCSTLKRKFIENGIPLCVCVCVCEQRQTDKWQRQNMNGHAQIWKTFLSFPFQCSIQFSSVTQSCPTLCNPMNRSTLGLPVHHQLPEFTQTHIHQVSDTIQSSHPL